jgi:hypothetical protein
VQGTSSQPEVLSSMPSSDEFRLYDSVAILTRGLV